MGPTQSSWLPRASWLSRSRHALPALQMLAVEVGPVGTWGHLVHIGDNRDRVCSAEAPVKAGPYSLACSCMRLTQQVRIRGCRSYWEHSPSAQPPSAFRPGLPYQIAVPMQMKHCCKLARHEPMNMGS